jgi:hypothetical protein
MKFDMEKLGSDIAEMVKQYVAEKYNDINQKIDSLKLQKGDKGEDGQSITVEDVKPLLKELVSEEIKSIPPPKDGEKGEKGDKGDQVDVDFVVDKLYHKLFTSDDFANRIVKLIPVPKDGKDGVNGKDASEDDIIEKVLSNIVIPEPIKGDKGDSVDISVVEELVSKAVSSIPAPKDGADGKDAEQVDINSIVDLVIQSIPVPKDGVDGKSIDEDVVIEKVLKSIPNPVDGKDGTSVSLDDLKPYLDASVAKWQVDFERNAFDILQKSVNNFPKPEKGEKGEDGFGIESFEQVDDRTVKAVYKRGDEIVEKEFKFPSIIYKGVYQQGKHEKGDAVTFAGSLWIAKKDTENPPSKNDDWQLAVKRGVNGKDAEKA